MNVLFICSRNQWRSPTAERIYINSPGISTKSVGTASSAKHKVTHHDIQWADLVIAMEQKRLKRLRAGFPGEMQYKDSYTLDIPDNYRYMDPELVDIISESLDPILQSDT